ncbi:hypothetical protein ANN_27470 [Periplaneta americana]|uniref:Uncharacterized protein n=1 Tax=Periplaneta americana TaxID=6978 RepID=A0ABQ8RVV1_PERAM|nr:hypothetical protein ANN_27470 [Periplaneta americana]
MSYYSEEYVAQGHALTSEVKDEENPVPISSAVLKHEPEERDFSNQDVFGIKEGYEDQSQDPTTEIKFEEEPEVIWLPVVKREPETPHNVYSPLAVDVELAPNDRGTFPHRSMFSTPYFEGHLVVWIRYCHSRLFGLSGMEFLGSSCDWHKEEYVNQSLDLISEVKFEEDPFAVVKREPEEEQSDLDTVHVEPKVEVTAEDNEIFIERFVDSRLDDKSFSTE